MRPPLVEGLETLVIIVPLRQQVEGGRVADTGKGIVADHMTARAILLRQVQAAPGIAVGARRRDAKAAGE